MLRVLREQVREQVQVRVLLVRVLLVRVLLVRVLLVQGQELVLRVWELVQGQELLPRA